MNSKGSNDAQGIREHYSRSSVAVASGMPEMPPIVPQKTEEMPEMLQKQVEKTNFAKGLGTNCLGGTTTQDMES